MPETLPLIEGFKKDLYHCADCNYCVDAVWAERGLEHVCPTIQSHTPLLSYSGRGYIAAARAWFEGAAIDLEKLGERVFTCTTCGHCETVCPIGLRPTQVGRALRGELWARDAVPAPLREWRAQMARDGNPHGQPRAERLAWSGEIVPNSQGEPLLYLPGCAAAASRDEALAATRIMTAAGYRVLTLENRDTCCGAPYFELGDSRRADAMRETLTSKLGDVPCVTSGLECRAHWWRGAASRAPQSFVEWVETAFAHGRLTAPEAKADIVVIESCQTRQAPAFANMVRKLFARFGSNVRFAQENAEHLVCCGAAGGMPRMAPESSMRMAQARLPEPAATYVVIDPRCAMHLASASSGHVVGLATWLARRLGLAHD